jgi:uncharacterized membrane protein (UPF0136 family)
MAKVSLTAGVDVKLAAKVVEQAEQAGIPLSVVVSARWLNTLTLDSLKSQSAQRALAAWPQSTQTIKITRA